ncbi:unnamed protein product [Parnassius apollo]|uniref:(apollo) hypothetical protein n=1 Tax=Parnassius apollo TaxID=110799 RepID=A0A8S3WX14_PARAO|nr:unnamed protein product [Parnassius apollo]
MASDQWSVVTEPHVKTSKGLRKSDIVAAKGGVGVIVDVQVVSGQRPLNDAHLEKRSKYGTHEELVEKVAGILGLPNKDCVHATSCTISWRGVWSHFSYKELKRLLGLKESLLRAIPVVVLRGSHMNWTRFSQMTGTVVGTPV